MEVLSEMAVNVISEEVDANVTNTELEVHANH